jgi:hypothetical protein
MRSTTRRTRLHSAEPCPAAAPVPIRKSALSRSRKGTHVSFGSRMGPCTTSELALAKVVLPRLLLSVGLLIPAQPVPAAQPPTGPKMGPNYLAGRSEGTPLHPKCDMTARFTGNAAAASRMRLRGSVLAPSLSSMMATDAQLAGVDSSASRT